MSQFGEFLVRDARIDAERIQKALRLQQTMGERLGTNLLEIGALTEEKLLSSLGRFHSSPTVSSMELQRISPVVIKQIPRKMALRYKVVPFQLNGKNLSIASLDPGDLLIEDEIGFLSGCMIKTHVCLEIWMRLALEKYYGKPAGERIKILARRLVGAKSSPTQPKPAPVAPAPAPPKPPKKKKKKSRPAEPEPEEPLFIELSAEDRQLLGVKDGGPSPSELAPPLQEHLLAPTSSHLFAATESAAPSEDEPAVVESVAESVAESAESDPPSLDETLLAAAFEVIPELEFEEIEDPLADHDLPIDERLFIAGEEFQQAVMRDEIADVIFAFAEPYLQRRMMLINRKGKIVGWRAEGSGVDPKSTAIREIEIGEHEPSVFLGLKTGQGFWSGPLPPLPPNQRLLEALGGTSSKDCLVLPIMLRGKLVCFFYGDNLGDSVASAPIPDLRRLVGKAGIAFEVYILKNKIRLL